MAQTLVLHHLAHLLSLDSVALAQQWWVHQKHQQTNRSDSFKQKSPFAFWRGGFFNAKNMALFFVFFGFFIIERVV
jgi:hypothetical protein